MLHDLSFDELEKRILILSKGSFAKVVSATDFPYSLKAVKSQNSLQSCTASVITINGRQQRGTKEEFNLLETPQVLISGEIHGDERVVSQFLYITCQILFDCIVNNFVFICVLVGTACDSIYC